MSNYAQDAKEFIASHRFGMLCTISSEGYPFGSIVTYAVSKDEQFLLIQIAHIAEHFQNLKRNPQSTLLVADPFGANDPTKYARATIFTNWAETQGAERSTAKQLFEQCIGNHIPAEIEPSFGYFRSEVEKIRWIGGFARVGWVTKEEYLQAKVDPLSYESYGIVTHMNEDHAQAVQEIVASKVGVDKAIGAKMIQAYSDAVTFRLASGEDIRVSLPNKCTSGEKMRSELIKILKFIRSPVSDES